MNGKKWISIYLFTISSFLFMMFGVIYLFFSEGNLPFRFSNSISYDAKLKFLHNNNKLLNESNTIVVGSSMALNNIDSDYLLKNEKCNNVINISSWALQVNEVFQLLKLLDLSKKKYIVYSTQFIDFQGSTTKNINENGIIDYTYGNFSFYPYISTINSLLMNINNIINYDIRYRDKNKYTYLDFDIHGDINFNFDNDSYINKNRWSYIDNGSLNKKTFDIVIELNNYLKSQNIELIVITTPIRNEIVNNPIILKKFNTYTKNLNFLSKKYGFKYLNTHK